MGKFFVKAITNVDELKINDVIDESDFSTLSPSGNFIQLEYKEDDDKVEPYKVKPGLFSIEKTMQGLALKTTSFVEDEILESFTPTKGVSEKIESFFTRLHIYAKRKIEVPMRKMLLYGPAGSGKSTIISKACRKYSADGKTAVVLWHTDKFEPHVVKSFIKSFDYTEVDKMILVVEDIGGAEMDQTRVRSDSSLLSLLDNQEKTFKIPTLIIATTNHPEIFLGNLTNRPGRFSDKIKVDFPPASARVELFKFFSQTEEHPQDLLDLVASEQCKSFTPDHLREVVIRSDLYEKTMKDVVIEMVDEMESYENAFSKKSRMGF